MLPLYLPITLIFNVFLMCKIGNKYTLLLKSKLNYICSLTSDTSNLNPYFLRGIKPDKIKRIKPGKIIVSKMMMQYFVAN